MSTANQWLSGSTERVCVVAPRLTSAVKVTVKLQESQKNSQKNSQPRDPEIYGQTSLLLTAGQFL